jgi:ribosomal protein S18 acetylase RimI-like enzyme
MTTKIATPQIRWLIGGDLKRVLEIDGAVYQGDHWSEEDFLVALRERPTIGNVVELRHKIVGFMVYTLAKYHLTINRIAVAPEFQRQGIGRGMIWKLVERLSIQRRDRILCTMREDSEAVYFLRACGFVAQSVVWDEFGDRDGYLMVREVGP